MLSKNKLLFVVFLLGLSTLFQTSYVWTDNLQAKLKKTYNKYKIVDEEQDKLIKSVLEHIKQFSTKGLPITKKGTIEAICIGIPSTVTLCDQQYKEKIKKEVDVYFGNESTKFIGKTRDFILKKLNFYLRNFLENELDTIIDDEPFIPEYEEKKEEKKEEEEEEEWEKLEV
jgi:hypothetical protein